MKIKKNFDAFYLTLVCIAALLILWLGLNARCHVKLKTVGEERVAYLKEGILQKRESVAWLVIPDGATVLERGAFEDCKSLEKVVLPESIKKIEERAFASCYRLRYIVFGNELTYIGDQAFKNCRSLSRVYIPNMISGGLSYVGREAFFNTGIVEIELPDGLGIVGENAFADCLALSDITLPYDLVNQADSIIGELEQREINIYAGSIEAGSVESEYKGNYYKLDLENQYAVLLKGENNLIPNQIRYQGKLYPLTWIGESAFEDGTLTEIQLPKYLYGISFAAFKNCRSLGDVRFPNDLKIIRASAFDGCAARKLELPNSLRKIGSRAFAGAEEINVPEGVYLADEGAFIGIRTLKLPRSLNINYAVDSFKGKDPIKLEQLIIPDDWVKCEAFSEIEFDSADLKVITY